MTLHHAVSIYTTLIALIVIYVSWDTGSNPRAALLWVAALNCAFALLNFVGAFT